MYFTSLRLSGFKSFVEPAELDLVAGLTGIVGPNGCGKSNLVEALRWVMGETSAKRMRGTEMDDVIFAGSDDRPSRNVAEVVLRLDNASRSAPAAFNMYDEIEVSRRIERGMGSDYRINGKIARARDVQLLFADVASGAHSPALVSQGKIAAIIAAKPSERRFLLEDAAGIGGLQARCHEAELKLRAASTNLEQVEMVLETLRTQQNSLKRQARQAERYRVLSEEIESLETALLHFVWVEATREERQGKDALEALGAAIQKAVTATTATAAAESEAEARLPALRISEGEASNVLRSFIAKRETLEAEQRQIAALRQDSERTIAECTADQQREVQEQRETETALSRLSQETEKLNAALQSEAGTIQAAETLTAESRVKTDSLQAALQQATETLARHEAESTVTTRRVDELKRQLYDVQAKRAQAETQLQGIQAAPDTARIDGLTAALETAQAAVTEAEQRVQKSHDAQTEFETALTEARAKSEEAQSALSRIKVEKEGLEAGLISGENAEFPAILDQVRVEPGYEKALAAVLGADLQASATEAAPAHWAALPLDSLPRLPETITSLLTYVKAPSALARALQMTGIVDADTAGRLHGQLHPGQTLVTKEGGLWRWDGLVRRDNKTSSEAVKLAQRNRLEVVSQQFDGALQQAESAARIFDAAKTQATQAGEAYRQARDILNQAYQAQRNAGAEHGRAQAALEESQRTRLKLEDMLLRLTEEAETVTQAQQEAAKILAALPDLAVERQSLGAQRQALDTSRSALNAALAKEMELKAAVETRRARLTAIADESRVWHSRRDSHRQHLEALAARSQAATEKLATLTERPQIIAAELAQLRTEIHEAEAILRQHSDALQVAEAEIGARRRAAREAEQALTVVREHRARAEAVHENAAKALEAACARLAERLNVEPDALAETIAMDQDGDRVSTEEKLAKLTRDRNAIGAVNLIAEQELQDIETQIGTLEGEQTDLNDAIESLRQAIAKLNREARERLTTAFDTVKIHFERLFQRLFGGGHATLTLMNLDQPDESGLEIYASPPGKKLQHLSLLSGGEQALTALALLFAMFMATPAPVCVLDEVDAPLDDANVDRFCQLLAEIAAETKTRFLVITHHRVTMARMDRLYGVTMAERGISMLVSVDLNRAAEIAEPMAAE